MNSHYVFVLMHTQPAQTLTQAWLNWTADYPGTMELEPIALFNRQTGEVQGKLPDELRDLDLAIDALACEMCGIDVEPINEEPKLRQQRAYDSLEEYIRELAREPYIDVWVMQIVITQLAALSYCIDFPWTCDPYFSPMSTPFIDYRYETSDGDEAILVMRVS